MDIIITRYYSISNLDWRPSWGGDITFYGDEETGEKHARRGYNIGYASEIIGHRPNRVVVYPHTKIHKTEGRIRGSTRDATEDCL